MRKIHIQRLTDLYNLLGNFPDDHKFDLGNWIYNTNFDLHDQTEKLAVECGTTCCAAGWACLMLPSWKKYLAFDINGEISYNNKNKAKYSKWPLSDSFETLSHFLGCSAREIDFMFLPSIGYSLFEHENDIGPHDVVDNIQKVISINGYELY